MTLLWHIVRKDARRLWIPLVVGAAMILAQHALDWRLQQIAPDLPALRRAFESLVLLLFVLRLVVTYILAAGFVFEDPATGTTAFWMTRPISGPRVLAAKIVVSLVFLVVVPLGLGLPWWALETNSISLLHTFEWQTLSVLAGLAIAALSTSVPRFVAWTVTLQLSSLLVVGLLIKPNSQPVSVVTSALRAAPVGLGAIALVFVLAVGVAVLARYQRRAMKVVWGALAVGVSAVMGIALLVFG